MSGKSHNLIELLPSAQSYNRNENFSSTSKTLLKNKTFHVVHYFT